MLLLYWVLQKRRKLNFCIAFVRTHTHTHTLLDKHDGCNCVNFCIELAVCFLAGFYGPKYSGFWYSKSSWGIYPRNDPAPWNYYSNVSGCMAGFHHFYPSDCNLFLVSGMSSDFVTMLSFIYPETRLNHMTSQMI